MAGSSSPLPKFGDWDPNDPASGEGFTAIFKRAGEDKKNGISSAGNSPLNNDYKPPKQEVSTETNSKSNCCCFGRSPTQA